MRIAIRFIVATIACICGWYVSVCGLTWLAWKNGAVQSGQYAVLNVMVMFVVFWTVVWLFLLVGRRNEV